MALTPEHRRLREYRKRIKHWKNWGPYLSDRAWGTVREDYSAKGEAWDYFPHADARSRTYRWNEDGLGGISDRSQYLCFAFAFWNENDPFLKERLFGLTGPQGNHGEDVKEVYFYLDSTPTHSYMRMLYKYPQVAFPYAELVRVNGERGREEFEYELNDTGVFDENRYFDIFIEYALKNEDDILVRLTAHNWGPEAAPLHVLPTAWFRNTWSWGYPEGPMQDVPEKPRLSRLEADGNVVAARVQHPGLKDMVLYAQGEPDLLFTENETNMQHIFGEENASPYVKDAFHRFVVEGEATAVNPDQTGTKMAAYYTLTIPPGESQTLLLRLTPEEQESPFIGAEALFTKRQAEADQFYAAVQPAALSADEKEIQRQAFAGMLWSKQLFYYDVEQWLKGDPAFPSPPKERKNGRNSDWQHLNNFDIISMPDKWEYPWYATWDLAFHCLPLVLIDPDFAKRQLILMTREWYIHPNGQMPAYEWAFDDVNPPVHAWAAWRVYKIDAKQTGKPDTAFLKEVFHKLLLNFTWWVNRKDIDGNNVFQGGFLGLDNISLFDRSKALPTGGHIDQSDGTAWMGFFSLEMLKIALELAQEDPVYQDMGTKFFEHFLSIARAISNAGGQGHSLWDEKDHFFYDALHLPDGDIVPLRVRSLVGLMPLLAVETLEPDLLDNVPVFKRRLEWFNQHKNHLSSNMAAIDVPGKGERIITTIVTRERLVDILSYMLDENEFLSPYGIRSLSKYHQDNPVEMDFNGSSFSIQYEPAESESGLFGGNSNWRGPVWFPINFLIIEALQRFYHYYGDEVKVEFPTGSGHELTLWEVADELSQRLIKLFVRDEHGERPLFGGQTLHQKDPHWRDYILFYEYFHADNGAGLGASHQTGWTGLVAKLLQQQGERDADED